MRKGIAPPLYELTYLNDSHLHANPTHPKLWGVTKEDFNYLRNTQEYRNAIGDDKYPFHLVMTGLHLTKLQVKTAPLEVLADLNTSVRIALCEDRLVLLRQKKPELFKDPFSDYVTEAADALLKLAAHEEHIDYATKHLFKAMFPGQLSESHRLLREIYRLFSPEFLNAPYVLTSPHMPKGLIGPRIQTHAEQDQFKIAVRKTKAGEDFLPMLPARIEDLRPLTFEDLIDGTGGET